MESDGNDVVSWPDRSANPKSCNATERCVGADHGQIVVRMQRDHLRLEPSRRIGTHGHALTAVHDMAVRDDVAISGNDEPGTARVRSGATDEMKAAKRFFPPSGRHERHTRPVIRGPALRRESLGGAEL